MKKLFFIILIGLASSVALHAQTATDAVPMTKEQKAQAKAAKEAQLDESLKSAGLTADESIKAKAIMQEMDAKGKDLRADTNLSEEDRAAKRKTINDEKKAKLIELMGADKYKSWTAIKKQMAEKAAN